MSHIIGIKAKIEKHTAFNNQICLSEAPVEIISVADKTACCCLNYTQEGKVVTLCCDDGNCVVVVYYK